MGETHHVCAGWYRKTGQATRAKTEDAGPERWCRLSLRGGSTGRTRRWGLSAEDRLRKITR
ncbi:MAG: hypothetical protein JNM35_00340 [Nitrospira sp.]|nr:hypothetical protein [Nitrospira sp.]